MADLFVQVPTTELHKRSSGAAMFVA
jgi:hypothetical protein